MMKRPAHQNSHGRVENALWYSLMSWPSEICGERMPKPRKLSAVSSTIAWLMSRVVLTMMTPTELGRMWVNMIRKSLAPDTRAESTNSRSRSAMNSPRTSRARPVHRMPPRTSPSMGAM